MIFDHSVTYNPETLLKLTDDWDSAIPFPGMLSDEWTENPGTFTKAYYDVVFDDGKVLSGVFMVEGMFGGYSIDRVVECRFSTERNMDLDFLTPTVDPQ